MVRYLYIFEQDKKFAIILVNNLVLVSSLPKMNHRMQLYSPQLFFIEICVNSFHRMKREKYFGCALCVPSPPFLPITLEHPFIFMGLLESGFLQPLEARADNMKLHSLYWPVWRGGDCALCRWILAGTDMLLQWEPLLTGKGLIWPDNSNTYNQ